MATQASGVALKKLKSPLKTTAMSFSGFLAISAFRTVRKASSAKALP